MDMPKRMSADVRAIADWLTGIGYPGLTKRVLAGEWRGPVISPAWGAHASCPTCRGIGKLGVGVDGEPVLCSCVLDGGQSAR